MSQLSEWINKRPQLKRPVFWFGILLILAGTVWFILNHSNFLMRSIGGIAAVAGAWVTIYARKPR